MPLKKKFTFGTCGYTRTSPKTLSSDSKAINILLPFEEALKLNLAVDECVRRLNSYNRSTKAGKSAALNLTVYFASKRIAINEDKV